MKVIEHLERAKEPLISFEIIPPLRGGDVRNLMALIEDLVEFRPPFIDITSHAAEVFYQKPLREGRSANRFATDLVTQIDAMNHGRYLADDLLDAEPSSFCIGVGGYPEKHFEAPNLAADIRQLKAKIAAGASYVVTQMFFDNRHYFAFVDACREAGITVPIIPGLKVLSARSQLSSIPRNFYVEIPAALADAVADAPESEVLGVGVAWGRKQVEELLARGVPSVHFYVMQSAGPVKQLMKDLR